MNHSDLFFGHHLDALSLGSKTMALILAVLLGGVVGIEREIRGQSAGLRTHVLVCVGACLITLTAAEITLGPAGARGDMARITAQIVSGVGFLGAGAILREGMTVHGLTTAASIWVVAAIGITIGSSPHSGELALIATVVVMGTLVVLNWLEDALHLKQRVRVLEVEMRDPLQAPTRLLGKLTSQQIVVFGMTTLPPTSDSREPTCRMRIRVRLTSDFHRKQLNQMLSEDPDILHFNME